MKRIEKREDRHYRKPLDETPTHTGGLSREAREKLDEHLRKDRHRGVYASTAKEKHSRDDRSRHSSERDRDRRDERRDRRDGRDRDRRADRHGSKRM